MKYEKEKSLVNKIHDKFFSQALMLIGKADQESIESFEKLAKDDKILEKLTEAVIQPYRDGGMKVPAMLNHQKALLLIILQKAYTTGVLSAIDYLGEKNGNNK